MLNPAHDIRVVLQVLLLREITMFWRSVAFLAAAFGTVTVVQPEHISDHSVVSQNGEIPARRSYFYVGGEYIDANIVSRQISPKAKTGIAESDQNHRMGLERGSIWLVRCMSRSSRPL